MRQVQAQEIMSTPVFVVRAHDAIPDVVRTLRKHAISGAPVVDEFGLMCGVVSEADIVAKEAGPGGLRELDYARAPFGRDPESAAMRQVGCTAEEIMTREVVTAHEDARVAEIASIMIRHRVNRVPIVRGEELVGIVTRADILSLFDRPPAVLLADVRTALRTDLSMDPNRFEIVVVDGIVQLRGQVDDARDISLIHTLIAKIDGVSAVDTAHLVAPAKARSAS